MTMFNNVAKTTSKKQQPRPTGRKGRQRRVVKFEEEMSSEESDEK